ncbi:MAG: hypothetical protein Q8O72_13740 [Bacteroidales bacterium]|nr:hypothetical protein [Bacteroidales bacterium]
MSDKLKNSNETPDGIKAELNVIYQLNKRRKSAIDKISMSISKEDSKTDIDKTKIHHKKSKSNQQLKPYQK